MNSVGSKIEARPPVEGGAVAIIGMACVFPGASNLEAYWHNIVSGVDAITEVVPGRWDPEVFFDPDSTAADRLYCKRGGYLRGEAQCNPLAYGIMPIVMEGGDPEQFLSLRVVHEALADAGYETRPFNHERTEVILGRGNYPNRGTYNLALHTLGLEQFLQILRTLHPEYTAEELETIKRELRASLPHLGPDTAGTLIPNLTTGRVANRLDLMGANFTVDAACASALIAIDLAVRDLLTGRCDLALVGGVHLATHVPFLAVFTQINALSRRSQIRPFDANADGTLPGEGVGVVVLKRREEAEWDGDRIYALIKGVGISSDGRGHGLLAPRVEGEELALRRAYEAAGLSPETVELIEAHGTGTPVGDLAEMTALSRVFGPRKGLPPTCAVGSIKSMIGHLMPAAGIAGLIKAALALYHKVLPPTLNCDTPNSKFELEKTPFYINTETRPWIHGAQDAPRRAGVNSFGFGGINAHVILEEHPSSAAGGGPGGSVHWETEVCLVQGSSRQDLLEQARQLEQHLSVLPQTPLKDLAYTLNTELREGSVRLGLVASSVEDLRQKLAQARKRLADPACRQIKDVRGLYFFEEPFLNGGKFAFLFPGERGQYPNMLKDLCLHFPEVRTTFDRADQIFIEADRPLLLSQTIFPIPGASDAERRELEQALQEMGGATAAILTANWALYNLLRRLEIRPDIVLGHSYGEYSALAASGILADDAVLRERLAERLQLIAEGRVPEAALVAVGADRMSVVPLLQELDGDLSIAMDNCPHQVVIAGREDAIEEAVEQLRTKGVVCQRLPLNRAYHTPMFAPVIPPLRAVFQELVISPPEIEIYSSATASPYPKEPRAIRDLAAGLWSRPVEFRESVGALYDAGVRIFVEVGPRGNLTAFVEDILRGRPHLAVPCDVPHRSGLTQLNHLIGVLAAHGMSMRLDYLYELRSPRRLFLDNPTPAVKGSATQPLSQPLPLHLPMMQLSPERAKLLEPRSPALAGQAKPRFVEPAPPSRSSLPDERLAMLKGGRPRGADHAGALQPPLGVAPEIMQEHLQTMERFLAVERQVMEAFLDAAGAVAALDPATPAAIAAPDFPFIGEVISLTPGREVVVRRRIDPDEDIFLRDHSYGGRVSDTDEALKSLPVLPFTMCMEIMAEAAALLSPGRVLTGMRQIQTRQWVEVGAPITLEITARTGRSTEEVYVEVRNLGAGGDAQAPMATATIEATVTFGDAYAVSPAIVPLSLTAERPCRQTAEQIYEERLMFHGPRFQGVVSLERSGENGIVGQIAALPRDDLFRFAPNPHLLTDPVLLDCAGQLLGYWAIERLDTGYMVFPFRLTALEIYGPMPEVGERVSCELEIHLAGPRQLRATMSLFRPNRRLLLRLSGWEDWRFYWPGEFYKFFRFPKKHLLTKIWEAPLSRFSRQADFACHRLDVTTNTTQAIVLHMMAFLILSQAERREWAGLTTPEIRRAEWLFGRAVAKDAVRQLLKARYQIDVYLADVEIGHDQDGRPFASVLGCGESVNPPSISIAHSDGLAVAVAGYCAPGQRLGIDVERVRPRQEAFQKIAFSDDELALLDSLAESTREEWVTRLWCAKEAVAKAVGKGLVEGPRSSLTVRMVEASTGKVGVVLGDTLARELPELAGVPVLVYTALEEDWVVASTLCERG